MSEDVCMNKTENSFGDLITEEQDRFIDVLGSTWSIRFEYQADDEAFKSGNCWGYAEDCEKVIILCRPFEDEDPLGLSIAAQIINLKRILRHEIVHAFLSESGLADSAKGTGDESWATNEEMIDWFARMSPKIFKLYSELGVLQ